MNPDHYRNISNAYQDVRLFSLHKWPEAAAYQESPGRGPYVVLQTGIDPDCLRASVQDFILGRDGRWLPVRLFLRLPQDTRRSLFVFGAVAEVVDVLRGLRGKPAIERGTSGNQPPTPENLPTPDSLNDAVAEAFRHGSTPDL
jgi:hypothetical protein